MTRTDQAAEAPGAQATNVNPQALRGHRLGPVGRLVLRRAAPPGAPDQALWVPCQQYHLAAARRLRGLGLVVTRRVRRPGAPWARPHGVGLTVLGQAVVEALGDRLRPGVLLRWDRVLGAVEDAFRRSVAGTDIPATRSGVRRDLP